MNVVVMSSLGVVDSKGAVECEQVVSLIHLWNVHFSWVHATSPHVLFQIYSCVGRTVVAHSEGASR
jgi:hypothetical protein